jgi:hypothetical protein
MNKIVVLFILFIFLSGCASVVSGRGQEIPLASTPSGADVTVDGIYMGTTPTIAPLRRKNPHNIVFSKKGYTEQTKTTQRKTNGWVWGNIVFGGIIGLIIDYSTGASYKIEPTAVEVTLVKV